MDKDENVKHATELVNADDFLNVSDSDEEDLYGKQGKCFQTVIDNSNVSEPSLKKVKVMIERSKLDFTSISNDKNTHPSNGSNSAVISDSNFQTSSKIETSTAQEITNRFNDQDDLIMSPIIRRRLKNTVKNSTISPNNQGIVNLEEKGDTCMKVEERPHNQHKTNRTGYKTDMKLGCEEKVDKNKSSCNRVIRKINSWNANDKFNDGNTFDNIASNIECFKAIEKSPLKYKFNKKTSPNVVSFEDIYKVFSGVKYIKSQAVHSFLDDPVLGNVFPDKSAKKGIAVLKSKGGRDLESRGKAQEEGHSIEATSEIKGDTRGPKRNTRSKTSSKIFDDMFDFKTPDSADEFQVDDKGGLNDYKVLGDKGNGKKKRKATNTTTGKKRKSAGASKSCEIKDKVKGGKGARGRGRGKGKATETDVNKDGSQVQSGICPLCQKVYWESQLEAHAAGCSGGDRQHNGNEELCPSCLKLFPSSSYKNHSLSCKGD